MKSKLWILLILIITISTASIMALGVHLALEERKVLIGRYQQIYNQKLLDIRSPIVAYLNQTSTELETKGSDNLVNSTWNISKSGVLLKNQVNDTEYESVMLQIKTLWKNQSLDSSIISKTEGSINNDNSSGWYPYFSQDGLRLIYVVDNQTGFTLQLINKAWLTKNIISLLPENNALDSVIRRAHGSLVDEHGKEIYSWGRKYPKEEYVPFLTMNLPKPLNILQLRYAIPKDFFEKSMYSSALFTIIPSTLLILSLLTLLVAHFFRLHKIEMDEATQRVNFANRVSHEIKTPLTNIRMYAELLERRIDLEDDASTRYLGIIVSESQRLSRLITSILTFSKRDNRKVEIKKSETKISQLLLNIIDQFQLNLNENEISVKTIFADDQTVLADSDAISEIVGNLISNTLKYSGSGKYLLLEHSRENSITKIRITDRGPGISADMREKIFEPFFRCSANTSNAANGAGLGLSISRALARQHGGNLKIIPSTIGAVFELTLETVPVSTYQASSQTTFQKRHQRMGAN